MIESVLYKKAKGGDLLACIFWLKPHRADIYDRKQVVAVAGDPDNPLSVDHTHHLDAGTVHIYIPDNGRNQTDTLLEPEPDFIRERREAYVATHARRDAHRRAGAGRRHGREDMDYGLVTAVADALRELGVELFYHDGELQIGGSRPAVQRFLAEHSQFFEGLDGILQRATSADPPGNGEGESESGADVGEEWRKFGDGAERFLDRLSGAGPKAISTAQLSAPPESSEPPPARLKLPPPPRTDSGIAYLDARGHAWPSRF